MPDSEHLDPRYDPRFQRGYDPAQHGSPTRDETEDARRATQRQAPSPDGSEPSGAARHDAARPSPAAQPAATASAPLGATGDDGRTGTPHDDAADPGWQSFDPSQNDEEGRPSGNAPFWSFWRNPFLIALVVIGVGLIVFGIDRYTWATEQLTGLNSQGGFQANADRVTPQVMWAIAPLLTVAGVLALVGVVFFAALRWLPSRRSRRSDTE